MPGGGLRQPAAVLVGPERCVGQRLARLKQLGDRGLGLRCQLLLGEPGDDTVTEASPGVGGGARVNEGCCGNNKCKAKAFHLELALEVNYHLHNTNGPGRRPKLSRKNLGDVNTSKFEIYLRLTEVDMGGRFSDETAKAEYIARMGLELGERFYDLSNELLWVQMVWSDHRALYASQQSIGVLNSLAPAFFWTLENVLWESVFMSLCRLTSTTLKLVTSQRFLFNVFRSYFWTNQRNWF